jgi:hypothetical protein
MESHGKVLQKGLGTLNKAAKSLGRTQLLLARKPPPVQPPPVRMAPGKAAFVKALPGQTAHIGAVAATKLSPKAMLAVSRHNAAVKKANEAKKNLAQHALKTKKAVQDLAKKVVSQKKISKAIRTPLNKRVHVGAMLADPVIGETVGEMLKEYYDSIGADPDPTNPGFLTDGSPDPAVSASPTTDLSAVADTGPLTEDPVDSGAPMPAPLPMDSFIEDMTDPKWGGIAYDNSKGTPDGYIVSYGMGTPAADHPGRTTDGTAQGVKWDQAHWVYPIDWMNHYGYVFGRFDPPKGGFDGGEDLAPGTWNEYHGGKGRGDWFTPLSGADPAAISTASRTKSAPNGVPYGPLVGNPAMKDFARMRVDGKGQAFWLPQEAPEWLLFPIKQAAYLTAQEEKKAAAAQKKLDEAALAKEKADNDAALRAQEAANALAESAAASTAKVAQAEEGTKQAAEVTAQAQAETQASQALVEQAKADTSSQAQESEQMKQAGELMLSQARRQEEYYAAHPEVEFAPHPLDEEGGTEEGTIEEDVAEDEGGYENEPGGSPEDTDEFHAEDFEE